MSHKELTLYRVNDPGDLETVYPTEMSLYPGFYVFPNNYSLAVSKDGQVMNVRTRKILKHYVSETKKVQVLLKTAFNNVRAYYVHRLLAITFIGRPSRRIDKEYAQLEVNHIDGNRLNNDLTNLEWVTGNENIVHAHLTGLFPNDKCVLARNIKTGTITRFNSSKACADKYGIHRATFWKHLKSKNYARSQKDLHVFKFDDETEWPLLDLKQLKTITGPELRKSYIVENKKSGTKTVFQDLAKVAKFISAPSVTVWRHIRRKQLFTNDKYIVTII